MEQQPRRPLRLVVLGTLALILTMTQLSGQFSSATLTSSSANIATVSAAADWTPPTVQMVQPPATVTGTHIVTADASDAESGIEKVVIQQRPVGSGAWTTLCTDTAAPFSCAWDTTAGPDGEHELRARATDRAGYSATSAVVRTTVANNYSVTLAAPTGVLRGTVTLNATVRDIGGLAHTVRFEYAPTGTDDWRTICDSLSAPYDCDWDTSAIHHGTFDLRAVLVVGDARTTSNVVRGVTVDNTVSTVALDVPALLTGTVPLTANASSTAGVTHVRIQYAPAGSGNWTTICTRTTAPYACAWNSSNVPDGRYDFRAVLRDGLGRDVVSEVVTARHVDNVSLVGVDVQAVNGGNIAGRMDAGDIMTFTWSSTVDPATVLAGWDGSDRAVTVRVRDGILLGRGGSGDTLDVLSGRQSVNLGDVNLGGNHVSSFVITIDFDATMTMRTVTGPDGEKRSVVTLRLDSTNFFALPTRSAGTMVWTPSNQVTNPHGRPYSSSSVTETGPNDSDF